MCELLMVPAHSLIQSLPLGCVILLHGKCQTLSCDTKLLLENIHFSRVVLVMTHLLVVSLWPCNIKTSLLLWQSKPNSVLDCSSPLGHGDVKQKKSQDMVLEVFKVKAHPWGSWNGICMCSFFYSLDKICSHSKPTPPLIAKKFLAAY